MAVSFLLVLALIPLFLLLIIPGLIFAVYWTFVLYALITDNSGIGGAFSHSKRVVSGRWWTVFGYLFLFGLIIVGLTIGVLVLVFIVGVFAGIIFHVGGMAENMNAELIFGFIGALIMGLFQMLITPLSLTFMEKFYLNLKENTTGLNGVVAEDQAEQSQPQNPTQTV